MGECYTREEFERDLKARREKEAREEEERRERAEKGAAKMAWTRDGGNPRDFERQWPEMRDEERKQRILGGDREAREKMRATGVSRI